MKIIALLTVSLCLLGLVVGDDNTQNPSLNAEAQTGTEFVPPSPENVNNEGDEVPNNTDLNELAEKNSTDFAGEKETDDKDVFSLSTEDESEDALSKNDARDAVLSFLPHDLPPLHSLRLIVPQPDFELHVPSFPQPAFGRESLNPPALNLEQLIDQGEDKLPSFSQFPHHSPRLIGGLIGPFQIAQPSMRLFPLSPSLHFHPHPMFGHPMFGHPMFGHPMFGPPMFGPPMLGSPMLGDLHSLVSRPQPLMSPETLDSVHFSANPISSALLSRVQNSVFHDLPEEVHQDIQKIHEAAHLAHEPRTLKLEKKNNFYIITGFFPGVDKTELGLKLEGSTFSVSANITTSDENKKQELANFIKQELGGLDEIGEIEELKATLELPYAPDSRLFKAHFDENTHLLTAVFPQEHEAEISLD